MIIGKNITCKYKRESVLKHISFSLEKGRITTFMGKSGAGKTTLLRCIANLHTNYEGVITFEKQDLKKLTPLERATNLGYVFQQFHLFPHFTALQNCTYALKDDAEEIAIQTLNLLGMSSYIHAFPSQLSGGQQQRVAIARALVLRPKILLLDEPTSALDPESKKSLESLLLDLRAQGITLALSSHDMSFIRKVMDRIYYLEGGSLVEEWDSQQEDLSSKEKIWQFIGVQK